MGKFGIVKRSEEVTLEELKKKFPAKKNTITDDTVELLNETMQNPDFDSGTFLTQLIDYQGAMIDASASMGEYINAIKFCAYLEAEHTVIEAYKRARANDEFVQDRWNAKSGTDAYNELSFAASRYKKSKLVRTILTQSDMPLYLMFQAQRYRAVAVLAREMEEAAYSKDRISAAKELLANVKPPENVQIELGIGPNQEAIDLSTKLSQQLADHVSIQKKLLEAGMDIKEATKTGLNLNDEVIDVEAE